MKSEIVYDTKNPVYDGWTQIVENIGRYFLSTVIENFNNYVEMVNNITEKDKELAKEKIEQIDLALKEHKTRMESILGKIKTLKKEATEVYNLYRETKIPYELFSKVKNGKLLEMEGKQSDVVQKDIDEYNSLCIKREGYLQYAKSIWEEITRLEKEYEEFMDGKGDYYNSLRRERQHIENQIDYLFQPEMKEKINNDKEKILAILNSGNMVARFNYLFRNLCLGVVPNFFSTYSFMDREEITSRFFSCMIEKGGKEKIIFSRILYKMDENNKYTEMLSEQEIYESFFKAYCNSIKGMFIKSLKAYQDENVRLIRVDGIKHNGEEVDNGYDMISNGQLKINDDISKSPVKTKTMEVPEIKECWDDFKKYYESEMENIVNITMNIFYNKDNFYKVYSKQDFENIVKYIFDNMDSEIRNNMYSVKKLKAFVYSAFGGTRSRTFIVKETQIITSIISMVFCEFVYNNKFNNNRKSNAFYNRVKEMVEESITQTWKNSNDAFDNTVKGYINNFDKKHKSFFEKN